jgi:hypothetical protein
MTIEQTPRALTQPQAVVFICPPCRCQFSALADLLRHWHEVHERWTVTR